MQRSLVVEFTKMNGAGNDFIVIDNRFFRFGEDGLARIAVTFCQRRLGIGADGLLALEESSRPDCDVRMRYHNADGSVGTMCGNGARCVALYARLAGFESEPLCIETDAGLYQAEVRQDHSSVRLWLPPPYPSTRLVREILEETDGAVEEVYPIWTGTEHAVCFVPDLASTDVEWEGRRIRRDPTFAPAGVNVDFVEIGHMDEAHQTAVVSARTFEKGVEAETLACGTGAVAAAVVAASRYYRKAAAVQVRMPGGTLTVGITRTGDEISEMYLDGPAAVVYRGSFEISA